MGHKKLIRFEEIKAFPNVLIYPAGMPGNWSRHFGNDHPVTLELACGKGEYTLALARMFPGRNFIGMDIKGNRIWKGAKTAIAEKLPNVAFLRSAIDKIGDYFAKDEVEEIWITFPDPFLRKSKSKKRLTHSKFLLLYHRLLIPGGRIHLKTDSPELYAFTLETIREQNCNLAENIPDVYSQPFVDPLLAIRTYYEGMHLAEGKIIRYLRFSLPKQFNDQTYGAAAIEKSKT